MVVISKPVFDAYCKEVPCYTLVHPWTKSCLRASPTIFKACLIGSVKFFAFIYLGQLLMQGKKLKKKEQWIKIGKDYGRSVVTGVLVSVSGMQLVCLLRNLLGRFDYHFFLSIPFALSGIFLTLESPSRRQLITNFYSNLVIEYCLKYLNRAGFISITKTKEVLLFMIGNSLLLYLIRLETVKKERSSILWLIVPEKVRQKSYGSENVCPHDGECKNYIMKNMSTYFGIGLAVSLAKVLIPRFKTPIKAISSISGRHFKLALFLSSYVGIYKTLICYLCRRNKYDSAMYALPAGCLAGLSMLFNPNLALSIASFTAAFKLYSTTLYEKNFLPSSIPLPLILFCVCQGTLYSVRMLDSEISPRYMFYLMNTASNGLSDSLFKSFCETFIN
ncbi:unnamed protein product [Arctia plantaginis]|uniref:Transmembrane protein 135 N-terminal domain-containing protein n=1 Tax=Arctia plantaginis TaxID=874455 RepID=A0A8S0YQU7_ARCPL|nr:unnamed protein product [Arctia plantaginis]CAB3251289.1 unnamed protein product [Arctia plantaginis]